MISADEPLAVTTFVVSKIGEEPGACEDVVRVRQDSGVLRLAASDGATTSSFSREWAAQLAEWFCLLDHHPNDDEFLEALQALGQVWRADIARRELPWHAEEKVRQGAFATFLGVSIDKQSWRALALGDTCLFHVRAGTLLTSFPYVSAKEFAARPVLACSVSSPAADLKEHLRESTSAIETGDVLIIATDGLAQWLLSKLGAEQPAWDLFELPSEDRLAVVVERERRERRMRNDDVGCAWLRR